MVEIAAHLVDHVIPPVPVRQWVLSLPKRLRGFLQRDAALAGTVLRGALPVCSDRRWTFRRATGRVGMDKTLLGDRHANPRRPRPNVLWPTG